MSTPEDRIAKQKLTEMDQRTLQAEKDLEEMTHFIKKFSEMEENLTVLKKEYHTDEWHNLIAKYHAIHPNEYHYSANEDAIWNVVQAFFSQKMKLLKLIAKSLE